MSLMHNCRKCGMALTWQDKTANRLKCDRCTRLEAAKEEGKEIDDKKKNPPPNMPPAA